MKYVSAQTVLPQSLLDEVQQYVQGELVYIPKRPANHKKWGANTDTKAVIATRNKRMREAHTHPMFNHKLSHRFGVWEENGDICGIACYEWDLGETMFGVQSGYESLLPDILSWSERELAVVNDGKHSLAVWVGDKETEKRDLLAHNGYARVYTEPVMRLPLHKPIPDAVLPEGFSLITLADENDPRKINACLWKGFDHGDEPDDDVDGRLQMQTGTHFNPALTLVVKAPDGEYACYLCTWYDERNRFSYLEPLATIPKYRHMGLATLLLIESAKRTKALGGEYVLAMTSAQPLYDAVGYEVACHREKWEKAW